LTNINIDPPHYETASVKGDANNNTLFLYEGTPTANSKVPIDLVYTFDTETNLWSVPKIIGVGFDKHALTSIVNYNEKMYLFVEVIVWGS